MRNTNSRVLHIICLQALGALYLRMAIINQYAAELHPFTWWLRLFRCYTTLSNWLCGRSHNYGLLLCCFLWSTIIFTIIVWQLNYATANRLLFLTTVLVVRHIRETLWARWRMNRLLRQCFLLIFRLCLKQLSLLLNCFFFFSLDKVVLLIHSYDVVRLWCFERFNWVARVAHGLQKCECGFTPDYRWIFLDWEGWRLLTFGLLDMTP